MPGPTVTMPAAQSQMFDVITDERGNVISMQLKPEWATLFQTVQQICFAVSRNGSTSVRPTSSFETRFEGMPFFDRTLGIPIWLKHASSNVWVDATGASV